MIRFDSFCHVSEGSGKCAIRKSTADAGRGVAWTFFLEAFAKGDNVESIARW